MSRSATVRGAAIWAMSGQYAVFAIQFAVSVLIARFFLGPEEMGLFSIALSAAMMVSILQDFGITRYVAGEPNLTDSQIRVCFSVSIVFALAIGLVIVALAWPIAWAYGDSRLLPLLLVVAGSYLLVPFGIVPSAVLQRAMDFRSLFMVHLGAAVANAVVALGLAAAGWSALSLAWAAVAQQGARALIGQWRSGWRPPFPLSFDGARPILRFGWGMSAIYMSGAVGHRAQDPALGTVVSFHSVGLYSRAAGLAAQLVTLVSGAVGGVFYPAFARIRDAGEDLAAPYLRVVSGYSAVTWPAMAMLAAASTPLVLMLYGETWAAVAPLLLWIALSEIFFTTLPLQMEIPILMGRMRRLFWLNVGETVASLGLLVVAATHSLEAAALSRVPFGVVWFLLYARLMHRLIGFRWRDMALVYAKSAAVSVAAVGPILLLYWRWMSPAETGFFALAAASIAGGLCWFGALFVVRHPVRFEIIAIIDHVLPAQLRPLFGRT